MANIGTVVELTQKLTKEGTFLKGHEFRVTDIFNINGLNYYHLTDGNNDLKYIDASVLRKVKGTLTLLNETGDIELVWSDEHEESMRALIEKKIREGYSFFIVERKLFGCIERHKLVKDISEIKKGTKLLLKDEDAVRLFEEGKIGAKVNKSKRNIEARKRTKDVDEILNSDTLAVRPIAGG